MDTAAFDIPIYQNHVRPELCKRLKAAGLNIETPFAWAIKENIAFIRTYHFDHDHHYEQAIANLDLINPPQDIYPAFTVMDMQKLIPVSYQHTRSNGFHSISCTFYRDNKSSFVPIVASMDRMPDAFAIIVLFLIEGNFIDIDAAKKLIEEAR